LRHKISGAHTRAQAPSASERRVVTALRPRMQACTCLLRMRSRSSPASGASCGASVPPSLPAASRPPREADHARSAASAPPSSSHAAQASASLRQSLCSACARKAGSLAGRSSRSSATRASSRALWAASLSRRGGACVQRRQNRSSC
jgi:hypothetical protein